MQIYSLFGPNFYINSEQGLSTRIMDAATQASPESNSSSGVRNPMWDSLIRLLSNIDINLSPTSSNTNTPDLNDMIFFMDEETNGGSANISGLSLEDVNQNTTLQSFQAEEGAEDTICNICQNVISNGTIVRKLNGCQHCFHVSCIDTWLMNHNSCPVCRGAIRPAVVESNTNTTANLRRLPRVNLTQQPIYFRTTSTENNNDSST